MIYGIRTTKPDQASVSFKLEEFTLSFLQQINLLSRIGRDWNLQSRWPPCGQCTPRGHALSMLHRIQYCHQGGFRRRLVPFFDTRGGLLQIFPTGSFKVQVSSRWFSPQVSSRPCRTANVWLPFMYSQKWNCEASLFPKQNYRIIYSVSQFLHSYICKKIIYFQDRSVYFAADWSWEYINRSQTHECGNWDWGLTISQKRNTWMGFSLCAPGRS
jgi:hypothetical protein